MNNQSWNKALIVDDEPEIRRAPGEALRGWGYETAEAETGAATPAAAVTERHAAALPDINLPDRSGLDLLREIKRGKVKKGKSSTAPYEGVKLYEKNEGPCFSRKKRY